MNAHILPRVMLRRNRRSCEEIVELVSRVGYEGKLVPGRGPGGKVVWLDTKDRESEQIHEKQVGTSFINVHEANLVARRVYDAITRDGVAPESIGVTSPYSAQVACISRKLQRLLFTNPELYEKIAFQVASVDSFQGDERDTMYVSLVVSNMDKRVGFLDELRRIRVALSRARNNLIIVGDSASVIDRNPDDASREAFKTAYDVIQRVGEVRVLPKTGQASRLGRRDGRRRRLA